MKRMSANNLSEQGLSEVLVKKTIAKIHKLIQRETRRDDARNSDEMLDMHTSLLFYFTTYDNRKERYNLNFFLMFEKEYEDPYIRSRQTIFPDGTRTKEVTCPPVYEFFDLDTLVDYNIYLKSVYKSIHDTKCSLEEACASAPAPAHIGLYNEPHNRRTLQLTPEHLDIALAYLKKNYPSQLPNMYFLYKTISTEKEDYKAKNQKSYVTNSGKESAVSFTHPSQSTPKEIAPPATSPVKRTQKTAYDAPVVDDPQLSLFDYARDRDTKKPDKSISIQPTKEDSMEEFKEPKQINVYYDDPWGTPLTEKRGKLYTQSGKLYRGKVWAPNEDDQWDVVYDPEWDKPIVPEDENGLN